MKLILPDGTTYTAESPQQTRPEPRPYPPPGWIPQEYDHPCLVLGYYDGQLKYSNATTVANEWDPIEGKVIPGKVIVRLDRRPDWQQHFEQLNTYRLLVRWIQEAFGWCDTGTTPEGGRIPYADNEIPFSCSIDCARNRRNITGLILFHGTKYVRVQSQSWNGNPNPTNTYLHAPHLTIKQVNSGVVKVGPDKGRVFFRADGDCAWMWVSPVPLVHMLMNVRIYPGYTEIGEPFQPFWCALFGFRAHVVQYCLYGSETWVRVDDGELAPGWYQADGHNVPPDRVEPEPGTDRDYFCNISGVDWPGLTPPVANWKKSYSFWQRLWLALGLPVPRVDWQQE